MKKIGKIIDSFPTAEDRFERLILYVRMALFREVGNRKPWRMHIGLGDGVDEKEILATTDAIQKCLVNF